VEFVAACAERIADSSSRPDYLQMAASQDSGQARFRVSLGSIPDYAANVEGVQLSGVRAGSPAEKAGLKQGDIIVKFGDRSIRNVQDYTVALGEHSPGDVVTIVVKRGTETVTLTATLAGSRR
jgi:S1-C subfamily serine protease